VYHSPHDVHQPHHYAKRVSDQPVHQTLPRVVKPKAGGRRHHVGPDPPESDQGKKIVAPSGVEKHHQDTDDVGRAGNKHICEGDAVMGFLLVSVIGRAIVDYYQSSLSCPRINKTNLYFSGILPFPLFVQTKDASFGQKRPSITVPRGRFTISP
jgi:hypothetical protein